jgi:hypothetical protein
LIDVARTPLVDVSYLQTHPFLEAFRAQPFFGRFPGHPSLLPSHKERIISMTALAPSSHANTLLSLDEAVEFLRGANARRTLQKLAWRVALHAAS